MVKIENREQVLRLKKGDILIDCSEGGIEQFRIREINDSILIADGVQSMKFLTPDRLLTDDWYVKGH